MIKAKTSELQGAALDWAVADALGRGPEIRSGKSACDSDVLVGKWPTPKFSTDWAQGGPLIEHEKIGLFERREEWKAEVDGDPNYDADFDCGISGPTPLIAAMRALVHAKLGDQVEVPAALVEGHGDD